MLLSNLQSSARADYIIMAALRSIQNTSTCISIVMATCTCMLLLYFYFRVQSCVVCLRLIPLLTGGALGPSSLRYSQERYVYIYFYMYVHHIIHVYMYTSYSRKFRGVQFCGWAILNFLQVKLQFLLTDAIMPVCGCMYKYRISCY